MTINHQTMINDLGNRKTNNRKAKKGKCTFFSGSFLLFCEAIEIEVWKVKKSEITIREMDVCFRNRHVR